MVSENVLAALSADVDGTIEHFVNQHAAGPEDIVPILLDFAAQLADQDGTSRENFLAVCGASWDMWISEGRGAVRRGQA